MSWSVGEWQCTKPKDKQTVCINIVAIIIMISLFVLETQETDFMEGGGG